MVIAHLPGRYLTESSPPLSFFLLHSVPLSIFSCYSRETLCLRRISCTILDQLCETISYAFFVINLCHYNNYFIRLRIFHISVSRWFSTEVWETVSHLKSLGLFSVFWPILIMTYFGWSPFVLLFPSPPVQFFQFPSKIHLLIFLFAFFQFYSVFSRDIKIYNSASSLFLVD